MALGADGLYVYAVWLGVSGPKGRLYMAQILPTGAGPGLKICWSMHLRTDRSANAANLPS
jgi:hypothetical protein